MKRILFFALICAMTALGACRTSNEKLSDGAVLVNGVPWYDIDGNVVNSHGSCIVKDGGRYWMFGEYKSDTTNAFSGFVCYSSSNLIDWRFERVVLPVQPDGLMGPNRVGERVKVMHCKRTRKYVMFMHSDDMGYMDPHTCVAIADSINGVYDFIGPLTYHGEPIHKWDIGTFQDQDGTGYLLAHHGPIYRLADDYLTADTLYLDPELAHSGESPALFRHRDTYYIMYSNLTSWERNDNFYFTSKNIAGPWKRQGLFCPEGTMTYNSQCTFVYPIINGNDTTFIYMGDRWSYPHQATSATQVWLPLTVEGESLSIPEFWEAWKPAALKPVDMARTTEKVGGLWKSNEAGKQYLIPFKGRQALIYGHSDKHGGYARITITNSNGKEYLSTLVDFYSLEPHDGLLYVSPNLPEDHYTLTITVNGDHTEFYNKKGNRFGSDDYWVIVTEIRRK